MRRSTIVLAAAAAVGLCIAGTSPAVAWAPTAVASGTAVHAIGDEADVVTTRVQKDDNTLCLAASEDEGTAPFQATCSSDTSQYWEFVGPYEGESGNHYLMRNKATGLCLRALPEDGRVEQVADCDETREDRMWRITGEDARSLTNPASDDRSLTVRGSRPDTNAYLDDSGQDDSQAWTFPDEQPAG